MAKKKYKKTVFNLKQSQVTVPVSLGFAGLAGYMWYATTKPVSIETNNTQVSFLSLPNTEENKQIAGGTEDGDFITVSIQNGYNLAKALAVALNVPYSISRAVSKPGIVEVAKNIPRSQYPAFVILFKEITGEDLEAAFTRADRNPVLFISGVKTKALFQNNMQT